MAGSVSLRDSVVKPFNCGFAALRGHIPVGPLREWEQGRSEQDQPAKADLDVIARDPEGVDRTSHSFSR